MREELAALRGTRKYDQILEQVDVPCDDVLLLLDVADREDIAVVWRNKDRIPRFPMTKAISTEKRPSAD